jgi:hypothetical protein
MSNELTLIIAVVGLCATILGIVTFFKNSKQDGKTEGAEYGEIESDIAYIKRTQTDILVGQRETLKKLDGVKEDTIRLDEKYKSIDKRVTKLEKDKEKGA